MKNGHESRTGYQYCVIFYGRQVSRNTTKRCLLCINDYRDGIIDLTPEIKIQAIHLRRTYKLKLPDAIIAATAVTLKAKFLTNDIQLHNILGLDTQNMRIN